MTSATGSSSLAVESATGSLRLFFGLPVSPPVADALAAALAPVALPPGWRWTPRANWHLTLLFIGAAAEAQVPALIQLGAHAATATAAARGKLTTLGGLPMRRPAPARPDGPDSNPDLARNEWQTCAGASFPPAEHSPPLSGGARLLAALTGDATPFLPLHRILADGVRSLGFAIEARPLLPHVTLARRGRGAAAWPMIPLPAVAAAFPIETLVLYRSESTPSGQRYVPLWTGRLLPQM